MIKFSYCGEQGTIDDGGFIRIWNVGFHIEDVMFDKKKPKFLNVLRKSLKGSKFESYLPKKCANAMNKTETQSAGSLHPLVRQTATEHPIFPCWLWETQLHMWWRCTGYPKTLSLQMYNSHWHPDQPEAPMCLPNAKHKPL
jgi:hypothetical protein